MSIAWPAKYQGAYTIDLLITGLIMRSESGRTVTRVTSHKFRADMVEAEPRRVSA